MLTVKFLLLAEGFYELTVARRNLADDSTVLTVEFASLAIGFNALTSAFVMLAGSFGVVA